MQIFMSDHFPIIACYLDAREKHVRRTERRKPSRCPLLLVGGVTASIR